jgi:hypothetical protein
VGVAERGLYRHFPVEQSILASAPCKTRNTGMDATAQREGSQAQTSREGECMKGFKLFSCLTLSALLFLSCTPDKASTKKEDGGSVSKILEQNTSGKVIKSIDDVSQVTVPQAWSIETSLNKKAQLQAANSMNEAYIIVLTDSKENFQHMTLADHSQTTREKLLQSLDSPTVTGPTDMTINGNKAVQYEIRGFINNVNIVYFHTTVETPAHFHQVLAWTLKSEYNKNKYVLQDVIKSFKETTPGGEVGAKN